MRALEGIGSGDRAGAVQQIAQACERFHELAAGYTQVGEAEAFEPMRTVASLLLLYLQEVTAEDDETRIKQLIACHPKYTPQASERIPSRRDAPSPPQAVRLFRAIHVELGLLRIGYLVRGNFPLDGFLDNAHQIARLHEEEEVVSTLQEAVNTRLLADFSLLPEPAMDEKIRETVTTREKLIILGIYVPHPDDSLVFRYWYSVLDWTNGLPHRANVFVGGEYAEDDTAKQVLTAPRVPFICSAPREFNQLVAQLQSDLQLDATWGKLRAKCLELEEQAAAYRSYLQANEKKPNAVFPETYRRDYAEISFADPAAKAEIVLERFERLRDVWRAAAR